MGIIRKDSTFVELSGSRTQVTGHDTRQDYKLTSTGQVDVGIHPRRHNDLVFPSEGRERTSGHDFTTLEEVS